MFNIKKITARIKAGTQDTGITDRISNAVLATQRKAADYLNRKTAGWSSRKTKTILILFCVVTGNAILFIGGRAVLSANGPPKTFKVQRLWQPAPLLIPGSKAPHMADSISKKIHH